MTTNAVETLCDGRVGVQGRAVRQDPDAPGDKAQGGQEEEMTAKPTPAHSANFPLLANDAAAGVRLGPDHGPAGPGLAPVPVWGTHELTAQSSGTLPALTPAGGVPPAEASWTARIVTTGNWTPSAAPQQQPPQQQPHLQQPLPPQHLNGGASSSTPLPWTPAQPAPASGAPGAAAALSGPWPLAPSAPAATPQAPFHAGPGGPAPWAPSPPGAVGPGLGAVGPGLGAVGPGLGAVGPGLGAVGPGLGAGPAAASPSFQGPTPQVAPALARPWAPVPAPGPGPTAMPAASTSPAAFARASSGASASVTASAGAPAPTMSNGSGAVSGSSAFSGTASGAVSGGGGGPSAAALVAELLAEAAGGGFGAATATALAPLPPGSGRSADELLAGLDLQDIFTPPRPSHAKRIRGHVKRAAELRSALADRVRAIRALAAANQTLRGRARVVEMVVRCRDEQLQLLRAATPSPDGRTYTLAQHAPHALAAAGRPADPPPLPPGAEPGAGAEPGPGAEPGAAGGGGGCGEGSSLEALAVMPAEQLLEMFRRLLADLAVHLSAVQRHMLTAQGTDGPSAPGPGPGSAAPLALVPQPPLPPGLAPTGPTPGGDPGAGPGAEAGPGSGGGPLAALRSRMAVFRWVVRHLGLVNDQVCRFVDTRLTGECVPPPPDHWLRVVAALGLSGQQRADAAVLYGCWQEWLAPILAERRALTSALDELLGANRYGGTYVEASGRYGTDRDTIHALSANVVRERVLAVLVAEVFCCHILTDLQWAAAIVHSYPYVYDARELVRAAAQMHAAAALGAASAATAAPAAAAAGAGGAATGSAALPAA
ncbi:hypothetical protein HYH03_009077 [Edaphochlamys debaryana]|uniref:Uncharacterized protein n=1 Tax=Edaphochlamys debaryana TaxID=47281 RepID=A0A835XX03_9CHLO|nr:hypothetical protein HYH03_009077 [Edaphochlamys debaryana]|eukprot:KAG2492662.1 hypothetical protein HYH03_009077 [Edaphochlamys debaryana]